MKSRQLQFIPFVLIISLVSLLSACKNDATPGGGDADGPDEPMVEFAKEGFLITSQTEGDNVVTFAGYFEEMPSGDIDLIANAVSFNNFRVHGVKDGFIYSTSTGDDTGLTKFGINKQTKELVKLGEIALSNNPGRIHFLEDGRAVTNVFGNREIVIFDPEEMVILGRVDMSQATSFQTGEFNYYTSLLYNPRTGKLYTAYFSDIEATPQFYDGEEIYVEVINATTLQWEKTIVHPNAEYPLFRGEPTAVIDEAGNTYLVAQGQYGLDNNLGPLSPPGSRPAILKINTNSEFDYGRT